MITRDRSLSRRILAFAAFVGMSLAVANAPLAAARKPKSVQVEGGLETDSPEIAEAYLRANASVVQKTIPEALKKCAGEFADTITEKFALVVWVEKDGKPKEVTADPADPFTKCVAKALESASFTQPPIDPAMVHFEMTMEF